MSFISYIGSEGKTSNEEMITWLSERLLVLNDQAFTEKERDICGLELMDPQRTQESESASSSSNVSSLQTSSTMDAGLESPTIGPTRS